ncbi:MAG: alpha/beta hydrolase [Bacilli bacterium]
MEQFETKINNEYSLRGTVFKINEPKAILLGITGMQEYSARYAGFAKDLNEAGYSFYMLDHFGQGLNARTVDDQQIWPFDAWKMTLQALKNTVEELRKQGKPVYLMGHSMGSFFVQSYLEYYPKSVEKAIIMGSNGPGQPFGLASFLAKITTTKKTRNQKSVFINNMALGAYAKSIKDRKTDLDWLSYNEENVQTYIAEPYCGHPNTKGFYVEFMAGMNTLYKKANTSRISRDEHILLVSGEDDPVGGKKGVTKLYDFYKKLGVKDVTLKLYPQMRHEILNELDRQIVVDDILEFLAKK